jgi:predicted ATPase
VPEVPPSEALNRFHMVFRRFIGALARPERPLLMFLDDLQWADAGSLELIEQIASDPDICHLILCGAYRENEVSDSHPLMHMLDRMNLAPVEVRLGPLQENALRQWLADTLHSQPASTAALADLIRQKTEGNPFFVRQFLERCTKTD